MQAVVEDITRQGFKLIEAVMDFGAGANVAPFLFLTRPVVPSRVSRAGGSYGVANGDGVLNIGQQAVRFCADENHFAGVLFHAAEIERPLVSATQMASTGRKVIFKEHGGEIVHMMSGRRIALHRRGNIYILRMWIPDNSEQSFARPGR